MSSQIDFRTLPANVPVLCIPRVYSNINESRIRKIFNDLHMGVLERIDIISKTTEKGEKFNRVFVHFHHWNHSENANIARERLLNGNEIKIIYDDPWFWKISAYKESEKRNQPPFNSHEERPTYKQYHSKQYSNRDYKKCYNNETPRPRDERPSNPTQHNTPVSKPNHEPFEDNPDENKVEYPPIDYGNITLPARRRIYKKDNTTNEDKNK